MNPFSGRFLLGYKFNDQLALQFGVMRPASWFKYEDIEYNGQESSVWVKYVVTIIKKNNFKLSKKTDWFAELGLGNFTRVGIYDSDIPIYDSAHYITAVLGAGIQHTINDKWDLIFNMTYLPEYKKHNQPFTFQSTVGAVYNLKQVPEMKQKLIMQILIISFRKILFKLDLDQEKLVFLQTVFFQCKLK